MEKDYYKILNVGKKAGQEEIKNAYRRFAFKYHPDKNPGNEEKAGEMFKDVQEAYYVIGDKKRRAQYDSFREGGASSRGGFADFAGFDFEDILRRAGTRTGKGGPFGDFGFDFSGGEDGIYTEYRYAPHKDIHAERDGYETETSASLGIPRELALTGGEAVFGYNGDKITLKIAPRTKNGQRMRLKKRGRRCPCCGHREDLIIRLDIR